MSTETYRYSRCHNSPMPDDSKEKELEFLGVTQRKASTNSLQTTEYLRTQRSASEGAFPTTEEMQREDRAR